MIRGRRVKSSEIEMIDDWTELEGGGRGCLLESIELEVIDIWQVKGRPG